LKAISNKLSNWVGGGWIAAMGVGSVAAMVHLSGHAPLGLVSLGVGVGLGLILGILAARLQITARKHTILLTVLLACVAVISQHAFIYGDFRRQWRESLRSPQVAMFRSEKPLSPIQYFSHEVTPERIALWCLDAGIIITCSVFVVWRMQRRNSPSLSP
jgi:ABC-type uncharacterized transport system permease subunit